MKTELTIGKVLKPHGIKGDVKIETFSSNPARFSTLKKLRLDGVEYEISKLTLDGAFGILALKGVDDMDSAELLRGKMISVSRHDLPKLADGNYYIADLLGLDVLVAGERIGELVDVLQYGSADVYVVKTAEGSCSFPALKKLIKSVDLEKGEMVLDDMVFNRVAVYN
ncbi:MAG: 16S rRNA processing protein RimM [Clostridia bacterium]|nr:16S rRNA processing protein RimM [Clostridia bacterium]